MLRMDLREPEAALRALRRPWGAGPAVLSAWALPDLVPEAEVLWLGGSLPEGEEVIKVILSSDGSAQGADLEGEGDFAYTAAWAFVVAFVGAGADPRLEVVFSGGLGPAAGGEEVCAAAIPPGAGTLDSGHAEAAGMLWAMAWAVQAATRPELERAAFEFQFDATYIGDAASGAACIRADEAMGEQLFGLGALVRELVPAEWKHVKGHSGDPLNELADAAARGARLGRGAPTCGAETGLRRFLEAPAAAAWAWMLAAARDPARGLPTVVDGRICVELPGCEVPADALNHLPAVPELPTPAGGRGRGGRLGQDGHHQRIDARGPGPLCCPPAAAWRRG